MEKTEWIRCPVCGNKTRLQIREDTELKNFPLYCPKCKQESLIEAKDLQLTVVKRPESESVLRKFKKRSCIKIPQNILKHLAEH